ncbi:MAG: hypothetical protein H6R38_20 [Deltaproteobacteria bacterium]|nr:hypothetical protein [Deltaproteobacteria bacterium]
MFRRPKPTAAFFRKRNGAPHDGRVPGVVTAGDVGRTDQRDHLFVQAERVVSETFTHVRIEVDGIQGHAGILHKV